MEKTVYIIKPEGMPHRHEIRKMIEVAGLAIIGSITTILPEWVFEKLYADLAQDKNELWFATLEHLVNNECEVGIIEGDEAVKKLFELSGEMTSPLQCKPETIRARFGKQSPIQAGNKLYWRNVIHRSKNHEEAASDLKIVYRLLTSESH